MDSRPALSQGGDLDKKTVGLPFAANGALAFLLYFSRRRRQCYPHFFVSSSTALNMTTNLEGSNPGYSSTNTFDAGPQTHFRYHHH